MSNLQRINSTGLATTPSVDISPNLSEKGKKVIENSLAPRCKQLLENREGYNKIYDVLAIALQKAVLIAGFKANAELAKEERNVVINEMVNVVKRHHWVSLADLDTILNFGLSGEFETDKERSFALNARTLNSWINAYHDKIRSPSMAEQSYHIQRQQQAEETRKGDLYFDRMKKRNGELLIAYCNSLAENAHGKITEFNFGSEMDDYLIAFYFTFKRYGLFADSAEEVRTIWNEETAGVTFMSDETKLKYQKICRIRQIKRYLVKLINDGVSIENHIKNML